MLLIMTIVFCLPPQAPVPPQAPPLEQRVAVLEKEVGALKVNIVNQEWELAALKARCQCGKDQIVPAPVATGGSTPSAVQAAPMTSSCTVDAFGNLVCTPASQGGTVGVQAGPAYGNCANGQCGPPQQRRGLFGRKRWR